MTNKFQNCKSKWATNAKHENITILDWGDLFTNCCETLITTGISNGKCVLLISVGGVLDTRVCHVALHYTASLLLWFTYFPVSWYFSCSHLLSALVLVTSINVKHQIELCTLGFLIIVLPTLPSFVKFWHIFQSPISYSSPLSCYDMLWDFLVFTFNWHLS